MTKEILNNLHAASFKGASFLIKSGTTSGGRKTVVHEYPNTDRRFVEDLGELKETFTIEGIVHGTNYFTDRDALILALKSGGSGELVHPFFGTVTVVAQPYTLIENTTIFGIARFSMTFNKSGESIFPRQSINNKSLINRNKNSVISSVKTDIFNIFNVSKQSSLNFTDAKSIMISIADAFEINSDTIFKVVGNISNFTSKLETFRDNVNSNAFDSNNLSIEFTDIFGAFELLGSTAQNQFDILKGLFSFGSDQEAITTSTLQRIERKTNRDILNSAVRTDALAQAYNVVTDLTFNTEDDVQKTQKVLDNQFEFIINDNNLSDNSLKEIKDLRVEVRKFLEQESVNAFRIAEVETAEIPIAILTYRYYGNVDNTQKIIDLNNSKNPTFIDNTVKILAL